MSRAAWRLLVVVSLSIASASSADALVRRSIQLDGDFLDWEGVLGSDQNVVRDAYLIDGDPDAVVDPELDLGRFAVTWDSQFLYLYFERARAQAQSVVAIAYIDRDHDLRLGPSDWVLMTRFDNSGVSWTSLQQYVPSGATDPVTGDGVDEPGDAAWALTPSLADATTDGLRLEARVDWVALGVTPGDPVVLHAATADGFLIALPTGGGTNLGTVIADNTSPLDTAYVASELRRDGFVAASGGYGEMAHEVIASGNVTQIVELGVTVTGGAYVELWTDPDGDGDPGDGVMMATDVAGDGDYSDLGDGDYVDPAFDLTIDGRPDTGEWLSPGQSFRFVVRVYVPPGMSAGDLEVLVSAFSWVDPDAVSLNRDVVRVGPIVVVPELRVSATQQAAVHLTHRVCNFTGADDGLDVLAATASGWPTYISSTGTPSATFIVTNGACASFDVVVTVPIDATIGATELVLTTATSQLDPTVTASAADDIEVLDPVTLRPTRTGVTTPGSTIFYAHELVNATAGSTSFTLTASATLGIANLWSDPDGDGFPWDGTPILSTPTLAAFGGRYRIVAEVHIPFDAPLEGSDVATVTAVESFDPATTGTVADTTVVRRVATYSQPPAAGGQVASFARCSRVYLAGGGLVTGEPYRFKWYDPSAMLDRLGPMTLAGGPGTIIDLRDFGPGDPTGTWRGVLQQRVGFDWLDVPLGGTHEFELIADPSASGGVISMLQPSLTELAPAGDRLSLTTVLDNASPLPFDRSIVEYLIYHDADGDGAPSFGEWFIDVSGASDTWVGEGVHTCRRAGLPAIDPGHNHLEATCSNMGPLSFAVAGTWSIRARWLTECADPIAERTRAVTVDCVSGASAYAGGSRIICREASTRLGEPGTPGWAYVWSPAEALDDPFTSQPWATPLTTITYGLQVSDAGGCVSSDEAVVIPVPLPDADAGPSDGICPGEGVTIGPNSVSGNSYAWSPADGLSDPSEARPLASPDQTTVYTLTVTSGHGCQASDIIEVAVHTPPVADPGESEASGGSPIGPAACNPLHVYDWAPPTGLSDPTACRPIADPAVDTDYCLTVRDTTTSCVSEAACVLVHQRCEPLPTAVTGLRMARSGANVSLRWDPLPDALGGYHAYRHDTKAESAAPTDPNQRVATTPDWAVVNAIDAGAAALPGVAFYRVVGVCADGFSEGP